MKQMKVIGVIPARYNSKRLPGKPLILISGKPLLQWVLEAVHRSQKILSWVVATDSSLIFEFVKKQGFKAIMTSSHLSSGTDRVWETVKDKKVDLVINVQGDEPLINGKDLDRLVELFEKKPMAEMATLGHKTSEEDLNDFTKAKIPLNASGEALYFSRFPVPFSAAFSHISSFSSEVSKMLVSKKNPQELSKPKNSKEGSKKKIVTSLFQLPPENKLPPKNQLPPKERKEKSQESPCFCLTHIGVYAYKKSYLKRFASQPPVYLEKSEGLEGLRALYMGTPIHVIPVEEKTMSLDTPEDKKKLERYFQQRFLTKVKKGEKKKEKEKSCEF